MALFGFGKKKEESCGCACSASAQCGCSCGSSSEQARVAVLGSGCKNCHTLWENMKQAAQELGLSEPVAYITDMEQIARSGVMSLPAVLVDGRVVSSGRVLSPADAAALLKKELG
ncbi:thioredoxin family protein [Gemmiger formicilis]|uniref:thioredoxin family protein n=1 Tax=Gemmiger formicilis TaxID=745368 RepID=UPI00195AC444|nr:thioredoxin family protein [Gemmiger formicilis]MBM6914497.1 thioredoxin family protein [Gemmiger formicilis]